MIALRTAKKKYARKIIVVASSESCSSASLFAGEAADSFTKTVKATEINVSVCTSQCIVSDIMTEGSLAHAAREKEGWNLFTTLDESNVISAPNYRAKFDGSIYFPGDLHIRVKSFARVMEARVPSMTSVSLRALKSGTDGKCEVARHSAYFGKSDAVNEVPAAARLKACMRTETSTYQSKK